MLSFVISSYPETLKLYFNGKPFDLSQEQFGATIPYLLSRNMIFYHSFKYYGIIIWITIPIIVTYNYLNYRSMNYDNLLIQRQGLKKYSTSALIENLKDSLIIASAPLVWWLILQLLPLTNMIVVEGNNVPGLESFYVNYENLYLSKELWNRYPVLYTLMPLTRIIPNVIVYSLLSFSIQIHFKNKSLGMIALILLTSLSAIISAIIFFDDPFFESMGIRSIVNEIVMIVYILAVVSISLISIYVHYRMRQKKWGSLTFRWKKQESQTLS